jgi:hypothetical protein
MLPPCRSFTRDGDWQKSVEFAQEAYKRATGREPRTIYVPPGTPALVTAAEVIETTDVPAGYLYLSLVTEAQTQLRLL